MRLFAQEQLELVFKDYRAMIMQSLLELGAEQEGFCDGTAYPNCIFVYQFEEGASSPGAEQEDLATLRISVDSTQLKRGPMRLAWRIWPSQASSMLRPSCPVCEPCSHEPQASSSASTDVSVLSNHEGAY